RRRGVVEKPRQAHPRRNRIAGFNRGRSVVQRGAGHGQNAQRFQTAAKNFDRIKPRRWSFVICRWPRHAVVKNMALGTANDQRPTTNLFLWKISSPGTATLAFW